jgi:hypothetical protein
MPGWQHICFQHLFLKYFKASVENYFSGEKLSFKIWQLIDHVPGHSRALMEMYTVIKVVLTTLNIIYLHGLPARLENPRRDKQEAGLPMTPVLSFFIWAMTVGPILFDLGSGHLLSST